MQGKKVGNAYILRLDPDDKVVESLKNFATENNIKLASISGLGAYKQAELAYFHVDSHQLDKRTFEGYYELVSFIGNITTMNDETYIHAHVVLSDVNFQTIGGHLVEAVISATSELIIHPVDGEIDREFNDKIGLNLFKL